MLAQPTLRTFSDLALEDARAIVRAAAELWDAGFDTFEIGHRLNVHESHVVRVLNARREVEKQFKQGWAP